MDNNISTYYNGKYNKYVGARYVPLFADPAEWNNTKTYEPLTIVLYQGNSYTSKTFVPVGVDINNETYWVETGNFNAQLEAYRQQVLELTNSKMDKLNTVVYLNNYSPSTSLSTAFENCFDALPNGGIIVCDGNYTLDSDINLPDNITVDGLNSTTFTFPETNPPSFQPRNNCIIKNCRFEYQVNTAVTANSAYAINWVDTLATGFENLTVEHCQFYNFAYCVRSRMVNETTSNKNNNLKFLNCYNEAPSSTVNSGGFNVWQTDNVEVISNTFIGGSTAASIGITGGAGKSIISNNYVYQNPEFGIQVESFDSVAIETNECLITDNVLDCTIAIDDSTNVICSNNICDCIGVFYRTYECDDIVVSNNITGKIIATSIYSPSENGKIKTLVISGNICVGCKYQYTKTEINNNYGIVTTSLVLNPIVINNYIKPNTFTTHDIGISPKNSGFTGFSGNNSTEAFLTSTLGEGIKYYRRSTDNYLMYVTKANRPTENLSSGLCVFDSTLGKPIFYYKNKWVDATGADV